MDSIQKKKNRLIDKANFNESVKIIKKYLSWNDDSGNKYHHLRDYTNRIESSYSQETSKKLGVSIYKFKWNLPLFSECCKLLSKKSFIFPGTVNLSDKILNYKNMIEYCEELLNPEKDLYNYLPDNIESINFWDDQELSDRIKYTYIVV